ncbi:MAG: M1 family metallopeptidase [bacterium]|nr:M1 family metallopeptidase [bacterium]
MNLQSLIPSCTVLLLGSSATAAGQSASGAGWMMTRLDLDVRVLPAEERMELEGTVHLRLDAYERSSGPALYLGVLRTNAGDPVMRFTEVACAGAQVDVRPKHVNGATHRADVRFESSKRRGDEVTVSFSAASKGWASQLIVHEEMAIASWTAAWLPFTQRASGSGISFNAGLADVPGRTRLHLPAGWIGIVDGSLVEREQTDSRAVEVWETPEGIARGFAAGRYEAVTENVEGREVHVYMLSDDKAITPQRLARLIADSMAAQEARLGPFPFSSYGVVERPSMLPGQRWYAASQQTFILADSGAFDHAHGNLPLWGHEMSHGWWGNTVGQSGPGSKWCGESLAQLGALIAIETLEGPEALHEFLAYSRSGYSRAQCASGYFWLLRQGQDQALARMGQGGATHDLADSKGVWVYHMLRQLVGDDVFFGVLRGVLTDLAHKVVTVAEMRRRFIAAAPQHDLRTFFAQWLDRTGAPILEVDWFAKTDGSGLVLTLTQVQEGAPFAFALDVEVELAGEGRIVETVDVRERTHTLLLATPERPKGVRLDPESKVLLWRPEYGPRPGDELPDEPVVPEGILTAVVGNYRVRGLESDVVLFVRDGSLYGQIDGEAAVRFMHREGGVFQMDSPGEVKIAEFDLSASPAATFKLTHGTREFVADRVGGE